MSEKQKVYVWAVDPFVDDLGPQKEAAQALHELTDDQDVVIRPVYLYSPKLFGAALTVPEAVHRKIELEGRARIQGLIDAVGLDRVEPLEVVSLPFTRLKDGARRFVEHARQLGADLIAVGTYARKGPKRWVVGSFTESMTEISDIPLLVLNPEWGHRTDFKRILFATDFSDESRRAFDQVLEFAREHGARVAIFHKMDFGLTPGFDLAFESYPSYQLVFEQEIRDRKALASSWVGEAEAAGVQAESIIDTNSVGSVAQAILAEGEKHPSLFALVSESGPVERVLLGSATRKVIRDARDPVWVVHPSPARARRKQVA